MSATRIDMGHYSLCLEALRPYEVSSANEVPSWGWAEVLKIFNAEATRLTAPTQPVTGEGIGHAKRLARHYDREKLTRMVYLFWQRHSESVYEGEYPHPLRSMCGQLAIIEREV